MAVGRYGCDGDERGDEKHQIRRALLPRRLRKCDHLLQPRRNAHGQAVVVAGSKELKVVASLADGAIGFSYEEDGNCSRQGAI